MSSKLSSSIKTASPINPPNFANLKRLSKVHNSVTYDFKAPKLISRSSKVALKLNTQLRSSIENLLVDDPSKGKSNIIKDLDLSISKDSIQNQEPLNNTNNQPELKETSLLDSPINSYKGSIIENEYNKDSPQKNLFNEKASRKSLSFSADKGNFKLKLNDFRTRKSVINSKDSSPSKLSAISSEKKVLNFIEKNIASPNTSFLKNDKQQSLEGFF